MSGYRGMGVEVACDELEALIAIAEAAEKLQAVYSIKRPKAWSGDDGHLEQLWDRIDSVREALSRFKDA